MAGRGRGRGRGRGTAPSQPVSEQPPLNAPPVEQPPTPGSANPSRGRGRGRGSANPGAAAASQIASEQQGPGPSGESVQVGRGRGRGGGPPDNNDSGRPRGGAVGGNGNDRGDGDNNANALVDRMGQLRVGERAPEGRQARERRVNRHDEENLSSGHFDTGDWRMNVESIQGQPVPLKANAIVLSRPEDMDRPFARQYHINFVPQIDSKRLRSAAIKNNYDRVGGQWVLYDGGSSLFTGSLISDPRGSVEFQFETRREETLRVTCTHTSDIFPGSTEYFRIVAVLMKRALAELNYVPFGRHYFDPTAKIPLDELNELMPGYATAVNRYEGGLLLLADSVFKLTARRTVYDELNDIHRRSQSESAFRTEACRVLVGRIVFTPYNQKRHRIDDISFENSPRDQFEKRGERITFASYYQDAYNVQIRDLGQPLLVSQPKLRDQRRGMTQSILLVPELCHITGISEEQRANRNFTTMMGQKTRQSPEMKERNLLQLVSRFSQNERIRSSFQFWNMSFDRQLIQFYGKRLNAPKIAFNGEVSYNTQTADFGNVLRNARFFNPVQVNDYAIFYAQQDEQVARTLSDSLIRVGNGFGMQFGRLRTQMVSSNRNEDWIEALRGMIVAANGQIQLCIFVLPDQRADRYSSIKRVCYIEQPVPSQCVCKKTLTRPSGLMSVVSKLAMQINAKLGGEPWITDFSIPDLMVVGMDVYHAPRNRQRSCVGVVGSLNLTLSRFYSRSYTNNEEEVQVMHTAMTQLLKRYQKLNKRYPKYIVMFRDGVGEGQLGRVIDTEVEQCKQALADLQCSAELCFVVVTKRIMQRFFAVNQRGGQLENPAPGTVVYDTLTKENRFDFFLAPTSSRQGTVTPTHYNVIADKTPFREKPGELMKLAFSMSHSYYNWTGAIRVPSVCQYAHKLAAMSGDSLSHAEPSIDLADTLFYL